MGMRIGLLVSCLFSTLGARYAVAQDLTGHAAPSAACVDLNQTAMNYLAIGRLKEAEIHTLRVLGRPGTRLRAIVWLGDTAQPGTCHGLIGAAYGSRGP